MDKIRRNNQSAHTHALNKKIQSNTTAARAFNSLLSKTNRLLKHRIKNKKFSNFLSNNEFNKSNNPLGDVLLGDEYLQYRGENILANTDNITTNPHGLFLLGRTTFSVGGIPPSYLPKDQVFIDYIKQEWPDLRIPNIIRTNGSFKYTIHHFKAYKTPLTVHPKINKLLLYALNNLGPLKLISLPRVTNLDIYVQGINAKANAGVISSMISGSMRRDSWGFAVLVALHIIDKLQSDLTHSFLFDTSIWRVSGREKANEFEDYPDITTLSSRCLLMPDNIVHAIGSPFAKLAQSHFTNNYQQPLFIGTTIVKNGYIKYIDYFNGYDSFFVFDYSKYDSSIPRAVVIAAFSIILKMFSDSYTKDEIFRIIMYLISTYIDTSVVTPGGWLYCKTRGTPSGSPFTTLINSLCNYLMVTTIFKAFKPFKNIEHKFSIQGDDIVVATKGYYFRKRKNVDLFLLTLSKTFGIKIKESSVLLSTSLFVSRLENSINFLGNYYVYGQPIRHYSDYIEMLSYPRRKIIDRNDRIDRAAAYLMMCPFESLASRIVYKFIIYCLIHDFGWEESLAIDYANEIHLKGFDLLTNSQSTYTDMRAQALGLRNHLNPWQKLIPTDYCNTIKQDQIEPYLGWWFGTTSKRGLKSDPLPKIYKKMCALPDMCT